MATTVVDEVKDPHDEQEVEHGRRVLTRSVMVVALRCTLQYIVLPFVLPFFGLGGRFTIWISAGLELLALFMVTYNIRRLWNTSWRWGYLALSTVTVTAIGLFLYQDVRALLQ